MYQSSLFKADFLEKWEASPNQSWDATKRKFGDQFGIATCPSNNKAKRSGFESTNFLCEHPPFYRKALPPTPAHT